MPARLLYVRALTLLPVVLAIPCGALAVFVAGVDRRLAADGVAWAYAVGLALTCTTAFWPLASLRAWPRVAQGEDRRGPQAVARP